MSDFLGADTHVPDIRVDKETIEVLCDDVQEIIQSVLVMDI